MSAGEAGRRDDGVRGGWIERKNLKVRINHTVSSLLLARCA
jgi:hypothetical protein